MSLPIPLLLTRPAAQSARFAAQLDDRLGQALRIIVSPILEIVQTDAAAGLSAPDALDNVGALVFTSENAVKIFATQSTRRDLVAICVGPRTEAAAQQAGLRTERGPGTAAGLGPLISRYGRGESAVLHLRGVHVARELTQDLAVSQVNFQQRAIYDQLQKPMSESALQVLAQPGPVIVPVFSPRSAVILAPVLAQARADLRIAAISPAVEQQMSVQSGAQIEVAPSPDANAMLNIIAKLVGGG